MEKAKSDLEIELAETSSSLVKVGPGFVRKFKLIAESYTYSNFQVFRKF